MAFEFISNNNHLFVTSFEIDNKVFSKEVSGGIYIPEASGAIIPPASGEIYSAPPSGETFSPIVFDTPTDEIYKLKDWYQLKNESTVPITIINNYDDFQLQSGRGVLIGGNNTKTNKQKNNRAFFLSNKHFSYDVNKVYRIKVRYKSFVSDSQIYVGFVGLTSKPLVLRRLNEDDYLNEMYNLNNFSFARNGIISDNGENTIDNIKNFAPIRKWTYSNEYKEYVGYISGSTSGNVEFDTHIGMTPDDPVKIKEEIRYVVPYFYVNVKSYSKTDPYKVIIDYIIIDEGIETPLETEINISDDIVPYTTIGYVLSGYINITGSLQYYFDNDYIDNDYVEALLIEGS